MKKIICKATVAIVVCLNTLTALLGRFFFSIRFDFQLCFFDSLLNWWLDHFAYFCQFPYWKQSSQA